MGTIALATDFDELALLRGCLPGGIANAEIYTLFSHVFLEFLKHDVKPHVLSEKITPAEAYQIYSRAFRDGSRIVDDFPPTEAPFSLNLARLFRVHYWEYLSEVYAMDLAIGRLLQNGNCDRLYFVRQLSDLPRSHVEMTDARFLVSRMLEVVIRSTPSRVEGVTSSPSGKVSRLSRLYYLGKRQVGRAVNYGIEFLKPNPNLSGAYSIAFGSGYDALIVIPDALRLSAEERLPPLWITEDVDKETARSGLAYRPEYDRVPRYSIRRHLVRHPVFPLGPREKLEADRAFHEVVSRLNQICEIQRYGLSNTWSHLKTEFRRVLWRAKAIERILRRFAGSTLVVTHFNGVDEGIIEQLAYRFGIRLLARPHGWMNSFEAFEYEADCYYCDGPLRARVVDEVFGYGKRIRLMLDPSLLSLRNAWQKGGSSERFEQRNRRRSELGINADYVILVMTTAARYGRALNEFDYQRLLDCTDAIFSFLESHPEVCLIVKSHKRNFDGWLEETARRRGISNIKILGGRLEDAVTLADLAVDLGKPGSATLVALLLETPLLLYRGLYKYVREFGDLVFDIGKSCVAASPQDLVAELEKFLQQPVMYSDGLRKGNQRLLLELADIARLG